MVWAGVRGVRPRRHLVQPGGDGAAVCRGAGAVQRRAAGRWFAVRLQVQHPQVCFRMLLYEVGVAMLTLVSVLVVVVVVVFGGPGPSSNHYLLSSARRRARGRRVWNRGAEWGVRGGGIRE